MGNSDCHLSALRTSKSDKDHASFISKLTQQSFWLGDSHIYCCMCESIRSNHPSALSDTTEIYLYSAASGLLRIKLPSSDIAHEVFELITRYEVSPYHIEDILEDQDIPFTLHYL